MRKRKSNLATMERKIQMDLDTSKDVELSTRKK